MPGAQAHVRTLSESSLVAAGTWSTANSQSRLRPMRNRPAVFVQRVEDRHAVYC
jgi:hypothetical protein